MFRVFEISFKIRQCFQIRQNEHSKYSCWALKYLIGYCRNDECGEVGFTVFSFKEKYNVSVCSTQNLGFCLFLSSSFFIFCSLHRSLSLSQSVVVLLITTGLDFLFVFFIADLLSVCCVSGCADSGLYLSPYQLLTLLPHFSLSVLRVCIKHAVSYGSSWWLWRSEVVLCGREGTHRNTELILPETSTQTFPDDFTSSLCYKCVFMFGRWNMVLMFNSEWNHHSSVFYSTLFLLLTQTTRKNLEVC